MKTALKVLVLAVGLTAVATPALAHGAGPLAPLRGAAAAVLGAGRAVSAIVAPAPVPGLRRVAPAHVPRLVHPARPIAP